MTRPAFDLHACLITRGLAGPHNYESEKHSILETARAAAEDGVSLIQIREKSLSGRLLFDLVASTVAAVVGTGTLVTVNERADVAVAAGAHGAHLPERSLPADVVRRAFGDKLMISVSTHALESAIAASQNGADYIFFGPVFATPGKSAVGLDALAEVCSALRAFPVVAIGGIDGENAVSCRKAGAAGIAAIRAMHDRVQRRAIIAQLAR